MAEVLEGLTVVDLSGSMAGAVTTMLLADYGADVVMVEPEAGSPVRRLPASVSWLRGKRSAVLDIARGDHDALAALVAGADVVVDDGAATPVLGALDGVLPGEHGRLVRCSITGYGSKGPLAGRPAIDLLVQARSGAQFEQPPRRGGRAGPIAYAVPLPSYGAALLANIGIAGALVHRERTGHGQRVETSLLQGMLAWTVLTFSRADKAGPRFFVYHSEARDLMPTPMYEAGDGRWLHPMPETVNHIVEDLGLTKRDLPPFRGGPPAERAYQAAVQELLLRHDRDHWLDLFARKDVRGQPILPVAESYDLPQTAVNDVVVEVDVAGVGRTRQFAHPYRVAGTEPRLRGGTPGLGEHTDDLVAEPPSPGAGGTDDKRPQAQGAGPLAGMRVLDFGLALAGPFGPMQLADIGADVIRVDNARGRRQAGARAREGAAERAPTTMTSAEAVATSSDQVWVACQRGKRSISLDMKTPEGLEVARRLIAGADVVHHNMRPGAAERLGIGRDDVRQLNPRAVYVHVTGFGTDGPMVDLPGSDQMAQALSGLEHEQGATPAGGTPTWIRLGITDHTTALLSVVGGLQALWRRERDGEPTLVEANILSSAAFLQTHLYLPDDGGQVGGAWHLDVDQTGLGPLYRMYRCADDVWLAVACADADQWHALATALGRDDLSAEDAFTDEAPFGRPELAPELEAELATRTAQEWFTVLDDAGVPCEVASEAFITDWYDDPQVVANDMVVGYEHPVLGRVEQLGSLIGFTDTPETITRPPVVPGQHTIEILRELGYSDDEITALRDANAVAVFEPEG